MTDQPNNTEEKRYVISWPRLDDWELIAEFVGGKNHEYTFTYGDRRNNGDVDFERVQAPAKKSFVIDHDKRIDVTFSWGGIVTAAFVDQAPIRIHPRPIVSETVADATSGRMLTDERLGELIMEWYSEYNGMCSCGGHASHAEKEAVRNDLELWKTRCETPEEKELERQSNLFFVNLVQEQFLSPKAIEMGYGLEDIAGFIKFLEDELEWSY